VAAAAAAAAAGAETAGAKAAEAAAWRMGWPWITAPPPLPIRPVWRDEHSLRNLGSVAHARAVDGSERAKARSSSTALVVGTRIRSIKSQNSPAEEIFFGKRDAPPFVPSERESWSGWHSSE
jgi:hypothetical protein